MTSVPNHTGPTAADYQHAREAFVYFHVKGDADVAFMENAGGSQVPRCVVNAISDHFYHSYAQLGAGYSRSQRATQVVQDAHDWLDIFMNTRGQGQVVIGPSTSQLSFNLAATFADVLGAGDNIVLQEASHESVLGPWVRLAGRTDCELRWWRVDHRCGASQLSDLEALVGPFTGLVVVTHVSNLLGEILDVATVVQMVRRRAPGAQVIVDGVAFAPHRAIDVSSWDVDWYLWSAYKVYGPHVGILYGKRTAYDSLLARGAQGPNFYFVPDADLTYKFELGGANHEACAGVLALQDYLLHLLAGRNRQQQQQQQQQQQGELEVEQQQQTRMTPETPEATDKPQDDTPSQDLPQILHSSAALHTPAPALSAISNGTAMPLSGGVRLSRSQVEAAFALMTAMEQPLQEQLLSYLSAHPDVRLVGSSNPDPAVRVPTISFVHRSKGSRQVAKELQAAGFAIRCGHMYARRLVEALVGGEGGILAAEAAQRQRPAGDEAAVAVSAAAGEATGGAAAVAAFDTQRAINEGVVRVSLLHYNTPDEVSRLITTLEQML